MIIQQYKEGRRDFSNLNLNCLDFRGSDLTSANFSNCDLSGANFSNCCLKDCNFSRANLRNAYFKFANLRGSAFIESDLSGACLLGARIRFATITRTKMDGVDLSGVNFQAAYLTGMWHIHFDPGPWEVSVLANYVQIGCKIHHVTEWESFTDDQIAAMDDRALEFWQEHRETILKLGKL